MNYDIIDVERDGNVDLSAASLLVSTHPSPKVKIMLPEGINIASPTSSDITAPQGMKESVITFTIKATVRENTAFPVTNNFSNPFKVTITC